MDVLKETLEFLRVQAVEASRAAVENRGHYWEIRTPDGRVEFRPRMIGPKNHVVASLDSLAELVQDNGEQSTLFVAHDAITAVLDGDPLVGTATCPLPFSQQHNALKLYAGQRMNQVDFVRMLRLDLDALPEQIAPFRRLDWGAGAGARGTVAHGRESLDKEVYRELQNASDVPESFVLSIPLYDCPGQRDKVGIRLNIDVDTATQTIRLLPAPGALTEALDARAAQNQGRLRSLLGDDWDIYLGSPGTWAKVSSV
jgi:hypothetical protein